MTKSEAAIKRQSKSRQGKFLTFVKRKNQYSSITVTVSVEDIWTKPIVFRDATAR